MSGSDERPEPNDDVPWMRGLLDRLTAATRHRRQLERGTPEYRAALETEERLAAGIWRRVSRWESQTRRRRN